LIQQLDLFGGAIPAHQPKTKKVVAKHIVEKDVEAKPIEINEEVIEINALQQDLDVEIELENLEENITSNVEQQNSEEVKNEVVEVENNESKEIVENIEDVVELIEEEQVVKEEIVNEVVEDNNVIELEIPILQIRNKPEQIIVEDEKIETVYQALLKRKRGRPRKERPINEPPKVKLKRGRKPFSEINVNLDLTDVPNDDELSKKMYYPISLVAKWFNVTNSQIRFWENEFDILKPKKNGKGDRHFRPEDIKNLKIIYHLLRQRKFSIEGAKEYLQNNQTKASKDIQLKESLQNIKSFLLELKANL
jgi:DNA-binding transcriptional MerR regulator